MRAIQQRGSAFLAMLAGLAGACTDPEPTPLELDGPPAEVALVSGNNQIGQFGQPLPLPLVVSVHDASGRPVPAHEVTWSASAGTLSPSVDSTGNDGVSSVSWTLPTSPGTFAVTASVAGVGSVNFSAQGTPEGHLVTFRYIDAGSYHGCGITTDEELLCWGYNGDGQLGIPASEAQPYPNLIPFEQRFRAVSGGRYHTCGLTLSGGITCWGQNRDSRSIPGDPISYQAVRAGLVHTCALNMSREIWCWGYNGEAEMGSGRYHPGEVIDTLSLVGNRYKAMSLGGLHTCAIKEDGTAWCWGFNAEGQVGTGGVERVDSLPRAVNTAAHFVTDQTVAPPPPDPDFPLPPGPFVAAGYAHSCALATDGRTLCWGLNENGQLGSGTQTSSGVPVQVAGGLVFVRITAGYSHTCGLTASGTAFCWGDNTFGQLGDGSTTRRLNPTLVSGGLTFAYLKAGDLSTCGVTTDGVGYCWGDNEYGQLGNGTKTAALAPVKIAFQK